MTNKFTYGELIKDESIINVEEGNTFLIKFNGFNSNTGTQENDINVMGTVVAENIEHAIELLTETLLMNFDYYDCDTICTNPYADTVTYTEIGSVDHSYSVEWWAECNE